MATHPTSGDLELTLLRTFLAVVRHGSMGKTAVAVEQTQPAVSQQMLRLEKIVGQTLFARGRNGITLTRHGELLVSYARLRRRRWGGVHAWGRSRPRRASFGARAGVAPFPLLYAS